MGQEWAIANFLVKLHVEKFADPPQDLAYIHICSRKIEYFIVVNNAHSFLDFFYF
jgi:hypothetical protein